MSTIPNKNSPILFLIAIFLNLASIIVILVSVKYFKNDYIDTGWHWFLAIVVALFYVYAHEKYLNSKQNEN